MNIKNIKHSVSNYVKNTKINHEDNRKVRLMIKSWQDYGDHRLNVFRECLTMWSEPSCAYRCPFDIQTVFIDHNNDADVYHVPYNNSHNKRIFFVLASVAELKRHHLEFLIENKDVNVENYMSQNTADLIYYVEQKAA